MSEFAGMTCMAAEPEFRGSDATTTGRQAVVGFCSTILQSGSAPQ